jgi:hypothetical protein
MNDNEARDGGGRNLRGLQPRVLLIIVCVAGGCVGALFGSIMLSLGTVLGGLGGVVAGFCWTWIMLGYSRTGLSRGKLVFVGTGWGIVVGLLATAILHGGAFSLYARSESSEIFIILLVAVVCAVVGGAITGAICGCIVPLKK